MFTKQVDVKKPRVLCVKNVINFKKQQKQYINIKKTIAYHFWRHRVRQDSRSFVYLVVNDGFHYHLNLTFLNGINGRNSVRKTKDSLNLDLYVRGLECLRAMSRLLIYCEYFIYLWKFTYMICIK